jgi:hypothetical protein
VQAKVVAMCEANTDVLLPDGEVLTKLTLELGARRPRAHPHTRSLSPAGNAFPAPLGRL